MFIGKISCNLLQEDVQLNSIFFSSLGILNMIKLPASLDIRKALSRDSKRFNLLTFNVKLKLFGNNLS